MWNFASFMRLRQYYHICSVRFCCAWYAVLFWEYLWHTHRQIDARTYTSNSRIDRIGISTETEKGEIESAIGETSTTRLWHEAGWMHLSCHPCGIDSFLRSITRSLTLLQSIYIFSIQRAENRLRCCLDAQHFMHSIWHIRIKFLCCKMDGWNVCLASRSLICMSHEPILLCVDYYSHIFSE